MLIFFSIFFTLYAAVNYYIFIRGWQALASLPGLRPLYLLIFVIGAISYFIARIFAENLPDMLYDFFLCVGSFWFAYILYMFLAVVLIDFIRLLNSPLHFFPSFVETHYGLVKLVVFSFVLIISSALILLGYLNSRNVKINTYNLEIKKGKSNLKELNVVLASDFHLTPVNNGKLLKDIVRKINSLNPDIVLLPGDIVDDKPSVLEKRNIGPEFFNIKAKYGVFASTGNHEFINGIDSSAKFITDHGMNLLRDNIVFIDNSFYVAGRDDRSINTFSGLKRKSLKEIIANAEPDYPVILLDHTPLQLEEAGQNNIALQVSGHTHHGQMFPNNLITKMIYEISWGYLKKEATHYYVSSGVGTWGPPVKLGSDTEIVNFKIKFVE